jgi:uncharacterized membrane protein YjgN (DUF898 family)
MYIFIYKDAGKPHGPLSPAQAKQQLDSGLASPEDMAWHDELPSKVKLGDLVAFLEKKGMVGPSATSSPYSGTPATTIAGQGQFTLANTPTQSRNRCFLYDAYGKPCGPYTPMQLLGELESGKTSPDDMVWCDGLEEKVKLRAFLDMVGSEAKGTGGGGFGPPQGGGAYGGQNSSWAGSLAFSYNGLGGDFFVLNLKNILLTICTLGIYGFWAKVAVRKFHWNNMYFMGDNLEYHATGKEMFINFLKGMLLLSSIAGLIALTLGALNLMELLGVALAFCFFLTAPFQIYSKQRFLLARTSWRNVRFKFTGTVGEAYGICIKGGFLSILTLGFYIPWFLNSLEKYRLNNSYFGNEKFEYSGKGNEMFMLYFKGILLSMMTFGIYHFWFQAELLRYKWNHTSVQGIRFKGTLPGEELFVSMLLILLSLYFTFGIALPWALVRLFKTNARHLAMVAPPDLAAVEASLLDNQASALGEGLGEASEAISELLGG